MFIHVENFSKLWFYIPGLSLLFLESQPRFFFFFFFTYMEIELDAKVILDSLNSKSIGNNLLLFGNIINKLIESRKATFSFSHTLFPHHFLSLPKLKPLYLLEYWSLNLIHNHNETTNEYTKPCWQAATPESHLTCSPWSTCRFSAQTKEQTGDELCHRKRKGRRDYKIQQCA